MTKADQILELLLDKYAELKNKELQYIECEIEWSEDISSLPVLREIILTVNKIIKEESKNE